MREIPKAINRTFEELKKENKGYLQLSYINGSYCVIKSTSIYDKLKKRPKKITEHLGVINFDGIFVKKHSRKRIYETTREIFEYGNCMLAYNLLKDIEQILKDITPEYRDFIASAIIKVIDPQPIRLFESRWEKCYTSKIMMSHLSSQHISKIYQYMGNKISLWDELFSKLIQERDFILYDLTAVFTYSDKLILAEKSYNVKHKKLEQIGIVLAFSTSSSLPIGIEVYSGSIKDISTLYDFKKRYPRSNIGFIFDRGFSSYRLLRKLAKEHIHYIVPLCDDSKYIDLRWLRWKGVFTYRKRIIRWAKQKCDLGYVYYFEDPKIRAEDETSLLKEVEEGKKTMHDFNDERLTAGIIGIVSDLDVDGIKIFEQYKGREDVELAFDAMKNFLESDKTYLRTPESIRGYFLVTLLSLRVYFKVLKRLRKKKLSQKISVAEVFMELSKINKIVEKNGNEYFAAIPKRAKKILSLFPETRPMV